MNAPLHDDFDTWLHRQLHDRPEPEDGGFSLRVMARLAPRVTRAQRRRAAALRWARWVASLAAAGGAAALLTGDTGQDAPHQLAALTLLALTLYWSLPGPWSRG